MFPQHHFVRLGAIPVSPTEALPGTEEKIRVMMQRAAQRQQLFHPWDGPRARLFWPPVAETNLLVPNLEQPKQSDPIPVALGIGDIDESLPQGEVAHAAIRQPVHTLVEV